MKKGLARSKSSEKKKKKSVLNKITDFFTKLNYHAYLVGGYVRDLTLGRRHIDIDIVVEGDGVKAAQGLNLELKGKLCLHREFGTASITTNNERIDLAGARVEKYPSPGELPHVYPSTIAQDLNRRDFTINAIAMSMSKENFGEIFDPFNGMQDIKDGLIRVLHKNSFIDDPTRIFRALRYKNRFGFKIESETKLLMKEAITNNMIGNLTGQRILNELFLIFAEPTYQSTIEDLAKSRVFEISQKDLELLPFLGSLRIYFYLSKLGTDKFPLKREERKLIHDLSNVENIMTKLDQASRNSIIYHILSPIDDQVVLLIPSIHPGLKNKIDIYSRLKKVSPFVKGNDLRNAGFKPVSRFSRLLKEAFSLQLDKRINSKKEALKLLKNK